MTPDEHDKLKRDLVEKCRVVNSVSDAAGHNEDMFLICISVEQAEKSKCIIVPGSLKIRCSVCQKEVFVSPQSKKIMDERKGRAMCYVCVKAKMGATPEKDHKILTTKDQIAEAGQTIAEVRRGEIASN